MRILFHISELDIGGAERMLYMLATGLVERGHEVEVACLTGKGDVGGWLEKAGIPVHYLNARKSWPPSLVLPLRKVVREFKPEVLHNFLFHANMVGRLVGWLSRVPAVICAVRVEDVERGFRLWVDGATHWMMHKQTCVSESARRFTHEKSSIPMDKLIAVPNAVDLSKFENLEPGRLRRELEVDAETPVLLTVGRLSRQKGLQHLLDAMPAVLDEISNTRLALVGAGEDEASLKDLTRELGIEGAVSFLGWHPEIPEFLKDADLFVLPSLWEGMPNVVLEAMASGVPTVATEVGGTPELVLEGETGVLVPPADSDALARSIITLLQDRELRSRMGQQALERAQSQFSPARMIERNEQLYAELLHHGG